MRRRRSPRPIRGRRAATVAHRSWRTTEDVASRSASFALSHHESLKQRPRLLPAPHQPAVAMAYGRSGRRGADRSTSLLFFSFATCAAHVRRCDINIVITCAPAQVYNIELARVAIGTLGSAVGACTSSTAGTRWLGCWRGRGCRYQGTRSTLKTNVLGNDPVEAIRIAKSIVDPARPVRVTTTIPSVPGATVADTRCSTLGVIVGLLWSAAASARTAHIHGCEVGVVISCGIVSAEVEVGVVICCKACPDVAAHIQSHL